MKTYSFDEAQAIVNKKIKESVVALRRELHGKSQKEGADRRAHKHQ